MDRPPRHSNQFDAVEALERAAPWLVSGIIVALVLLSILSAVLRTPWGS